MGWSLFNFIREELMSKTQNFVRKKGKSTADYRAKQYSHGTYRCKRKPNSKLCNNGTHK